MFSAGSSSGNLGSRSRDRLFVHHGTKWHLADFVQHLSAVDPNLIQLKQFVDGFYVSFSRQIEEASPLIHFLFFSVRGSPSLHA